MKICDFCERPIEEEYYEGVSGTYCSEFCMKEAEPRQVCDRCGRHDVDTEYYGGAIGEDLCPRCSEDVVTCNNCGDYCWEDNGYSFEQGGETIHACCGECYDELRFRHSEHVYSYGHKPAPIFYPISYGEASNKRYYGVECELDTDDGTPRRNTEDEINDKFSSYVYMKYDGSLSEGGVEIVSHPMTFEYHKDKMQWGKLFGIARNGGLKSTEGAGMHVHISNDSFSDRDKTQANLARIFKYFWNEILDFSEREQWEADDWARRPYFEEYTDDDVTIINSLQDEGRYQAVNVTNYSTTEIRIFRSVDNYDDFIRFLDFVDNVVEVADTLDWLDIRHMEFEEILNYKRNKENLKIA